ncbi:MAG TPA: hypothetical protein VM553_19075 [Dongiaceae bacterium]|nr:hypothetical protein [Dongiaceae bacterium]
MKKLVVGSLALALVAQSTVAIPSNYIEPVWRPFLLLAGDGDPAQASQRLQRIKQLQTTMLNHTRYDAETQAFIDSLWRSLEKFDLNGFYTSLPDEKGRQRELNVRGLWQNDAYLYERVPAAKLNGSVAELPLGHTEFKVGALRLESFTGPRRYVLNGQARVGAGASSWQTIRQAGGEIIALASYVPYVPDSAAKPELLAQNRAAIRQYNPALGAKDVEFLLPLWTAFPHLAQLIASLANIDDVLVEENNQQGYSVYTASLALDKSRLSVRYPALGTYLEKVGDLLVANVELHDENGRLARIEIDTRTARLRIETVLSLGGVVPTRNGELLMDKVRKLGDEPVNLKLVAGADVDVFGVRTHVSNLTAQLHYQPEGQQLVLGASINKVPDVTVDGAFMGVVSTGVIDAFIPGDIDGIVTEFFRVACEGNLGNGITAGAELRNTQEPGLINVKVNGTVVTLDNSFVQMGLRIFNTRMIPNDQASDEIQHLFFATQEAFYQDFDHFLASRNL